MRHRTSVAGALLSAFLVSACQPKTNAASDHLAEAQSLLTQHKAPQALAEVKTAIGIDPRNKTAHLLAARIFEAMGNATQAFAEYTRADMLDPTDHQARFKLIAMLIDRNVLDAALGKINATLGDDPNSLDALAYRALVESRQGNAAKSRVDASRVIAAAPGHPVANAALANLALRDDNPADALKSIERGLATVPLDTTLLQLEANAFVMRHDTGKAIDIYRTLVAGAPTTPSYRLALAELQAATSAEAGEATLRDGVAAAPDSQPMRLQLVGYLIRRGNPTAVDATLREAIAATPDGSTYDLALAGETAARGKTDDAVAIVQTAIGRLKEGPARTAARIGLARLLAAKRDAGGAGAVLDDVLKADPTNDTALVQRAALLTRSGNPAGAVSDLLAVATRQPANPAPFALLATAYLQLGRNADALDALKRIADLNPANLGAAVQLADLYGKLGRLVDAKLTIDDFVGRNPDSVEGRVAAIRIALAGKDMSAAQTALDGLRRLPGTERVGLEWEGQLKEAQGASADAAALYKRLLSTQASGTFNSALAQAFVRTSLAAGQGADAVAVLTAFDRSRAGEGAWAIDLSLAALYDGLGQADRARAATDAAIHGAPKNPAGYMEKAAALARAKQPDQAVATLDAGLAAGAPRDSLLPMRAALEVGKGDGDAAITTYRAIVADHPDAMLAVNNLTSLLADRKPLDKNALKEARDNLSALAPTDNASVLDTMAWADYRLGDYAAAKSLLDRAHADTSQTPQIRFHYGAVVMALGDKAAGRSIIKAVLGQDFPGRVEAQDLARE